MYNTTTLFYPSEQCLVSKLKSERSIPTNVVLYLKDITNIISLDCDNCIFCEHRIYDDCVGILVSCYVGTYCCSSVKGFTSCEYCAEAFCILRYVCNNAKWILDYYICAEFCEFTKLDFILCNFCIDYARIDHMNDTKNIACLIFHINVITDIANQIVRFYIRLKTIR